MKTNNKILTMLFISFFLALTGCNSNTPSNTDIPGGGDDISDGGDDKDDNKNPIYLSAPIIYLDNATGRVSWDVVENAQKYKYYINGGEYKETTNTYVDLREDETVAVMSYSDEKNVFSSEWSKPLSYVKVSGSQQYSHIYFHDSNIDPVLVKTGFPYTAPLTAQKEHYEFSGWYKDAFLTEPFENGTVISENTILYAKWTADDLMNKSSYFVSANKKITEINKTPDTAWHYISLSLDEEKTAEYGNRKAFSTIVKVENATTSDPARWLVMDGIDNDSGRTYWINDKDNFLITSDGYYKLIFSIENEWKNSNGVIVHGYSENIDEQIIEQNKFLTLSHDDQIETPVVSIDRKSNIASWTLNENASRYEYIIDNGEIVSTTSNNVTLYQGSYIVVRAIAENEDYSSRWSMPYVHPFIETKTSITCSVFFHDSGMPSYVIDKNTKIERPTNPTKGGYEFVDWTTSLKGDVLFDFNQLITKDTVIYAKWNRINDLYEEVKYHVIDSENEKLADLKLNKSNKGYNEYVGSFTTVRTGYIHVVPANDHSKILYSKQIGDLAEYDIYFSLEHLWDTKNPDSKAYVTHKKVTYYFTNTFSGSPYAYAWKKENGQNNATWPGVAMTYAKTNASNQNIYSITLYRNFYDFIIFTNGKGDRTCDIPITDVQDGTGFYYVTSKTYGTYMY